MIKISQHEIPCARVKFKTPLLLLQVVTVINFCIPCSDAIEEDYFIYICEYRVVYLL